MVTLVLRSDDELLHVSLYSWFISEDMAHKLIEVSSFQLWLAMSELTCSISNTDSISLH